VRDNKPKRSLIRSQRGAVHRIGNDHFRFHNSGVQLSQREGHAIAVFSLRNDDGRQRGAAELLAVRNPGALQQLRKEYTLVFLGSLFMWIRYGECRARHFLQVLERDHERLRDVSANAQFRGSRP